MTPAPPVLSTKVRQTVATRNPRRDRDRRHRRGALREYLHAPARQRRLENEVNERGERFVWLDPAVVNRLRGRVQAPDSLKAPRLIGRKAAHKPPDGMRGAVQALSLRAPLDGNGGDVNLC